MKKRFMQLAAVLLALSLAVPPAGAVTTNQNGDIMIRVGLASSNTHVAVGELEAAHLENNNSAGYGFGYRFGYYDGNLNFVELARTGGEGRVSANGRVYQDAVAYALVRNRGGRVKTYKENIYHQLGDYRFIASDTDRANYILGSLNGKPAKQVYKSILHVTDEEILTRTFQNPFGKLNGDDTCIISIKEVQGNALACFRQVNDSDVLILLELGDYQAITRNTIAQICQEFPRRSAIFSVNCLFRYKLFSEHNYMQTYLREMAALGCHAGVVGYGEHYNNRFVNQSMTCVVFE